MLVLMLRRDVVLHFNFNFNERNATNNFAVFTFANKYFFFTFNLRKMYYSTGKNSGIQLLNMTTRTSLL